MAAAMEAETLSCSICLDLLKDPVTIACGHSYCLSCITEWRGEEDQRGIHSCPECVKPRSDQVKTPMLAASAEELKKTGLQAGDVACDDWRRKLKALKSCLACEASLCHLHLQPHLESPAVAKLKLVHAATKLRTNICSQHNEEEKIFCRSDQQCICYLCSLDEHKGHDKVSVAAERRQKQKELQESQQAIQQTIQDKEEDVKVLQQEFKNIDVSADEAVDYGRNIFSDLIRLMEKRSRDVEQQIRSQQKVEMSQVIELQEKLKQEITELKSKDAELQQLSHIKDHCHFLKDFPSESLFTGSPSSSSSCIRRRPCRYFEGVAVAVSESNKVLQELLWDTWANISLAVIDTLLSAEPRSRAELLRYACDITLDPNTAHTHLFLSEGNTRTTWMDEDQPYPDHPDRFTRDYQVLSRESLSGRCYWEVGVRGGEVEVAVAYKNIRAKDENGFGYDDKSWSLRCYNQGYAFWYKGTRRLLSGGWSSTVGVYLDQPAGAVSFYSVTDTVSLLHTVQTSFTQPLHAGLLVNCGASATLCKLK